MPLKAPLAPNIFAVNLSSIDVQLWLSDRRTTHVVLTALYCLSIFLALDLVYSRLIYVKNRSAATANEYYDHGLLPNFEGYEPWGLLREKFYTNSLGFKDFKVRTVAATTNIRRTLLIGDSFTEGVGLKFEDTFAGLLYRAGLKRKERIEFLNAGVVSYSPVIYYKKVKYLLDAGLRFDEVVVFSDLSDVEDEATSYFCIDDHQEFRQYCPNPLAPPSNPPSLSPIASQSQLESATTLGDYFVVSNAVLLLMRHEIDRLTGGDKRAVLGGSVRIRGGWTLPGFDPGKFYDPLGVAGGINRSLANMQALADLLHSHGVGLTIVVYPWPLQLVENDLQSRQVTMWRTFCAKNCKGFINLFPAVFAEKDARKNWYDYLFIPGDFHYSVAGNRVLFEALAQHLL